MTNLEQVNFWAKSAKDWAFIARLNIYLKYTEDAVEAQKKAAESYKKMVYYRNLCA